jgi:hypothetical protein
MTEFFYHQHTGETHNNQNVFKHHFTFGDYYQPTKFGRSTLRRADYITLHNDYNMIAQRDYVLLLYPLQDIDLTLNDVHYPIVHNQLSAFVIPKDTHITIKLCTDTPSNLLLCECDIAHKPETVIAFDFNNTDFSTQIKIIDTVDNIDTYHANPDNKPFFGLILQGNAMINDTKLGFYDGFYTNTLLEITGNAKIVTFTMPVPL